MEPAKEDDEGNIEVTNEDAFLLTQWLEKGVFQALVDKYLKCLTFAVLTNHPFTGAEIVLEEYDFNLDYSHTSGSRNAPEALLNGVKITKQSLKEQANKFVRALIDFSATLENIPEHRWITLQLSYVDETPMDYQPMYFVDAQESLCFSNSNKTLNIKIGKIQTPHHLLDVEFKGLEHFESLLECDEPVGATRTVKKKSSKQESELRQGCITRRFSAQYNAEDIETEEKEAEAQFTPPSDPTDGDEDSDEPESPYELVKAYVTKEGKSVLKDCVAALSLSVTQVRRVFATLIKEGFLVKDRARYDCQVLHCMYECNMTLL